MGDDEPVRTVDAVVREHCETRREGLVGRRRRRVDAAEAALRACFERHGEPALTDAERALLDVERLFEQEGAIARVAAADALLLVVPAFLREPEWFGVDAIDRRLRALLGWRLAHRVARFPEFVRMDLTAALRAIDDAEAAARREMHRDEAAPPRQNAIAPPLQRPFPSRTGR